MDPTVSKFSKRQGFVCPNFQKKKPSPNNKKNNNKIIIIGFQLSFILNSHFVIFFPFYLTFLISYHYFHFGVWRDLIKGKIYCDFAGCSDNAFCLFFCPSANKIQQISFGMSAPKTEKHFNKVFGNFEIRTWMNACAVKLKNKKMIEKIKQKKQRWLCI